jgi:hypothetical protein
LCSYISSHRPVDLTIDKISPTDENRLNITAIIKNKGTSPKRFTLHSYWRIPNKIFRKMNRSNNPALAGLFLLILAIGRLLLSHAREEKEVSEQRMFSTFREKYSEAQNKRRSRIDSVLQAQGHIFLYTNDTAAQAFWIPNRQTMEIGKVRSILSPQYDDSSDEYQSGRLVLIIKRDSVSYPINQNFVFNDHDSSKHLYFMVLDSKAKLPKDSALLEEFPEAKEKFAGTWGMGIANISKLKVTSLVNYALKESVKVLGKSEGFYIYMVAGEEDNGDPGFNSAEFMKSVGVLNRFLSKSGMDTTSFHVKIL